MTAFSFSLASNSVLTSGTLLAPRPNTPPMIETGIHFRKRLTVGDIQVEVCRFYGVEMHDLMSHRRGRDIARPRQIAMYLAKCLTPFSYPKIARLFRRDHSTVMHAIKVVEAEMFDDLMLEQDIGYLKARLA